MPLYVLLCIVDMKTHLNSAALAIRLISWPLFSLSQIHVDLNFFRLSLSVRVAYHGLEEEVCESQDQIAIYAAAACTRFVVASYQKQCGDSYSQAPPSF